MNFNLWPVLLFAGLIVMGCSPEPKERMTIGELEAQLSEELPPGSPLSEVMSTINWIGLKADREPIDDCIGFADWGECGRILPAYFLYAKTGYSCNTDIVVIFRFDEIDYLENFVLRERWLCL